MTKIDFFITRCFYFQMLYSDFLSKNIFITVGTVRSSTDLILQKIEFVNDGEKRVLLLDLLHNQSVGMASSMVCNIYHHVAFKLDGLPLMASRFLLM